MPTGRYSWISRTSSTDVVDRPTNHEHAVGQIDRVLTHRWLGVPIFLRLMWIVFKLTADVSAPYLDWIDGVISGPVTSWMVALFSALGWAAPGSKVCWSMA